MKTPATLATLMLLVGCGNDVCQKRADIAASCGLGFADTTLAECHEAFDTCSKEEKVEIKKLYECLLENGFEDCSDGTTTSGTSLDQVTALQACEDDTKKISDSCLASVGGGPGTTFTLDP